MKPITFISCILTGLSVGLAIVVCGRLGVENAVGVGIGSVSLILAAAELFDLLLRATTDKALGFHSTNCWYLQASMGAAWGVISCNVQITMLWVITVLAISMMYHDLLEVVYEVLKHARTQRSMRRV